MTQQARPRYYPIGKVAELTGLPAYTLRYWEQEFKQLSPGKTRTGRRKYSEKDIEMIETIQELLHTKGYTIKGAKEILDQVERPKKPKNRTPAQVITRSEREIFLENKLLAMKRHLAELIQIIDEKENN